MVDEPVKVTLEEEQEIRYAGLNSRLFAACIDMLLSLIIFIPFVELFIDKVQAPTQITEAFHRYNMGEITQREFFTIYSQYMLYEGGLASIIATMVTDIVFAGIVVVMFWAYKAATPGKMIMKMKIVDAKTLGAPSTGKLILRYVGYILSAIPLGLGFWWIGLSRTKQGWHDKLAGTWVIHTNQLPSDWQERRFRRQAIIMILLVILYLIYINVR